MALLIPFFSARGEGRQYGSETLLLHPEVERALGFDEYLQKRNLFNKEQDQGLRLHLETLEIQAREYEQARKEFRREQKLIKTPEHLPSYQEHLDSRQGQREDRILAQKEQQRLKAEEKRMLGRIRLDAMKELGLPETRPRYEIEKRSLYGGDPKFSRSKEVFPSGGGYTPPPPSAAPTSPGSDPFPPPAFDDFPPPAFPEDNFDVPPPPMPMDGDPGAPSGGDDFFPPPPPPPPFEDNFNF